MKRLICLVACGALLIASSGCAGRSSSSNSICNWFRGASCNTCKPPAGQPANCGTNIAPGCEPGSYGTLPNESLGPSVGANGETVLPGGGVPYYSDPALNGTSYSSPTYGTTTQNYAPADLYGSGSKGSPEMAPPFGN